VIARGLSSLFCDASDEQNNFALPSDYGSLARSMAGMPRKELEVAKPMADSLLSDTNLPQDADKVLSQQVTRLTALQPFARRQLPVQRPKAAATIVMAQGHNLLSCNAHDEVALNQVSSLCKPSVAGLAAAPSPANAVRVGSSLKHSRPYLSQTGIANTAKDDGAEDGGRRDMVGPVAKRIRRKSSSQEEMPVLA
jgi:hypothetical protein